MKKIGEIIKDNRKKMKLTQKELALYANVSPKFIIELEKGKETVELNKVYDVLNVFDLTIKIVSIKEVSDS